MPVNGKTEAWVRVEFRLDVSSYLKSCKEYDPEAVANMTEADKREMIEEEVKQILRLAPWGQFLGIYFSDKNYEILETELVEQPPQNTERRDQGVCEPSRLR